MQTWSLPRAVPTASPVQHCVGGLIGAIGRSSFASDALLGLNGALAAGSLAVYQRFASRPPVLHLSASLGVADTTGQCFATYRDDGLYRRDASLDAVRAPAGQAVMLRMHADEAPNAEHREAIYMRHGVVERLSVATRHDDGSVLAVNLYHHRHQGRFSEGEVANFAELAPVLLAGVSRHLQLCGSSPPGVRQALRERCAALTERELDVLERLLQGLSYDGIAADLGVSLATVKTYRARAFERLNLHFKSELFAAFLPRR
jgi:DNA-binding NarL/FixJ family response regulator